MLNVTKYATQCSPAKVLLLVLFLELCRGQMIVVRSFINEQICMRSLSVLGHTLRNHTDFQSYECESVAILAYGSPPVACCSKVSLALSAMHHGWTTQAMADEERLVDVEDGLDTLQQEVAAMQACLRRVQAEIAGMRAARSWIQRIWHWLGQAARSFPWQ